MLNQTEICNLALQHIGEDDRIDDIDESSRAARSLKRAWDGAVLFTLSEANWSFALRTVALTARAADADFTIALDRTAFPLPADMVRLTELVEPAIDIDTQPDAYCVEAGPDGGQELLIEDDGPITIRYVRKTAEILSPASWPPAFAQAIAFRLAWQVADVLSADKRRKKDAQDNFELALAKAKRVNAKTKSARSHPAGPWVRSRTLGTVRGAYGEHPLG